ncbi:MAG: riboflavin biosynthesis protein RibF [Clostridia bacterium]|nr:riboflavin biosynthesis protein RibF [Clostridia bacterium]MDE7182725.1 riboflavin biosynthesis protein RibF [Clostridia bacterium]
MLEIIRYNEDNYEFPSLLVLGCFDGLHIGHAELLKKAKLQAKINGLDLGIMMFKEGKGGRQLYTFEERMKLLEQFNVKFVLLIDFTDEFKKITPQQFLQSLDDKLNVKALMSGRDFRFGADAKGKSAQLKAYAEDEDNGIWYMPVKDETYVGEKVSTTLIKNCLEQGNVVKANALLGRNYSVTGIVIEGANRGKKVVGFPTVNMRYPVDKVEVKKGVYKVKCLVGEEELIGIANYGGRPTFNETSAVLEAYIDGFTGSLYGRAVTIEFIEMLRETEKFESVAELTAQLKEDLKRARLKV